MSEYLDTLEKIRAHSKALEKCGRSFRARHMSLSNRIETLTKQKNELEQTFTRFIAGLESEIELIRHHRAAGTRPDPSREDPSHHQQAPVPATPQRLRPGILTSGISVSRGSYLIKKIMYKPEQKSLIQLKMERTELIEKIKNGAHLDSLAMSHLTRALADKERAINEHPDTIALRKEVNHG